MIKKNKHLIFARIKEIKNEGIKQNNEEKVEKSIAFSGNVEEFKYKIELAKANAEIAKANAEEAKANAEIAKANAEVEYHKAQKLAQKLFMNQINQFKFNGSDQDDKDLGESANISAAFENNDELIVELDSLTVKEIQRLSRELEIENYIHMSKEEIIVTIIDQISPIN